jgi:hypothetical protein
LSTSRNSWNRNFPSTRAIGAAPGSETSTFFFQSSRNLAAAWRMDAAACASLGPEKETRIARLKGGYHELVDTPVPVPEIH